MRGAERHKTAQHPTKGDSAGPLGATGCESDQLYYSYSNVFDMDKDESYEALMGQVIEGLPNETAIQLTGRLIDLAGDLERPAGTSRALEWCDSLEQRDLSDSAAALLAYFRANAWANRQREKRRDRTTAWTWEQPELQEQVLSLRRAVNAPGFQELESVRRCQILTNLANQLDTVGRFVEALEHWDRALAIDPHFGMALGNRGYGLEQYARALYDPGHRALFLFYAHQALSEALSQRARYDAAYGDAKRFFSSGKARIERIVDIAQVSRHLHSHSLGESAEEQKYRCWCFSNRLFLNPLNDLGIHSIAGSDVLTLPGFVTPLEEPPTLIGFFDQMKQEFVSARWLFYEGSRADDVHFSDRGVELHNTLDYPSYALAVEKVKATYRIAYSILDKIAFFLNDYMLLGFDPARIYFRSIWYNKKQLIHPKFEQSENWPFRGLFWLSKDLFDEAFRSTTEPDSKALHDIRNHLEHKYLKIHEMHVPQSADAHPSGLLWTDRLAYSVQRGDFQAKTLRLLKLVRAGLIYLSLGMHATERRRRKEINETTVFSISLDRWDDEWKR